MIPYRDPKTQKRIAVLRPMDPPLALRRLAEWNALMDKAADATSAEMGAGQRREASELWLEMKREQSWRFMGWLAQDTSAVVDDKGEVAGQAAPGDLHENEDRLGGWR